MYVGFCWLIAAIGGFLFGYDIGISGGVTAMDDFLIKFFPKIYERKLEAKEDNYCKYDNQYLQLFTSSLYISALIASFIASILCKKCGRRTTIMVAGACFIAGAGISAGALGLKMLILGRIVFGFGVGFGNEAVPLFLSEVAPVQHRGAVNILFQLFITIGILVANLVNYAVSKVHPFGWRISLGLTGVPAIILFFGSMIIVETPASLMERGKESEACHTLKKIRGVGDVDAEFDQLKISSEKAKEIGSPWKNLLKKSSIPPLVIGVMLQIFQQFTGINAIMFYAPILFQTIGFKNKGSLLSAVVTGTFNVLSTLIAIWRVDKAGRKKLLLVASVILFISQTTIGVILSTHLKPTGSLSPTLGYLVLGLVCVYVIAFACSWGPLGWLIPSETFPLETRTSGFAVSVGTNMLCTAIIAQAFLTMMCSMHAYIFFFFAAWIVVMGLFVLFLLPETKNVPIDAMCDQVWSKHWFWRRFIEDDGSKEIV
ncbi:hypothetical protein ACFE04_014805 [Oxalis oulophora]